MAADRLRTLFVCLVAAFLVTAVLSRQPAAESALDRIKAKAELAKSLILERAQAGEDISGILETMNRVKAHLDGKEISEGEALLDELLVTLHAEGETTTPPRAFGGASTDLFHSPREVEVSGYDPDAGVMEPFLTRDGRYLLFNNGRAAHDAGSGGKNDKNLHYATGLDARTFAYGGEIEGANSDAVDGAPSLDRRGRLYFISARQYKKQRATIHTAAFEDGRVAEVSLVDGEVSPDKPGWLNMDAEISADGRTLYYTVNKWDIERNIPATSDLRLARLVDGRFEPAADAERIFRRLNTTDLEYAPALSADELEIFFTRARFRLLDGKLAGMTTGILMASRASPGEAFGDPRHVAAITGLVEGPSLSPDGRFLYYHKAVAGAFRLYMVERRR